MGVKENIIRLRKLTGVTQEELGKIAGVSRSAVSLWEIGESEPRMGSVQSIADYFHIRKANIIEDGGMNNVFVSATGSLYETMDSDAVSPDERRILDLFRACSPDGREYMLGMAETTARLFPKES